MMRRRIISIISVFAVICSLFQVPVFASKTTNVDEYMLDVLQGLDIIDKKLPARVTNDIFISSLMYCIYDKEECASYTAESFARTMGLIGANEKFNKNSVITTSNALKYCVMLLGYNNVILPGINYRTVAGDAGLLDGVDVSTANLKVPDMVTLIYNLLNAEPLSVDYNTPVSYSVQTGETLLSVHRDIYTYKGIVTADYNTSIYSEEGVIKNCIQINDYLFVIDCEYSGELLGCYVNAYVKDDGDDDASVVYITEARNYNDRLVIEGDKLLSVYDNYSGVKYQTESGKEQEIDLDSYPKVIYNGKFYGDYTKSDLMPENGYTEFIDNDRDGKYEIINVKSYQTVVVESLNSDKGIITNKLDFDGVLKTLLLDVQGGSIKYSVEKGEEIISLTDIRNGDVLSVAMSKSADDNICRILVSSDECDIEVNGIDLNEKEISDGEEKYNLSTDYIKHLRNKGEEIKLGNIYQFKIDSFGKIVYSSNVTDGLYVLCYKVYKDESDDAVSVKFIDIDGVWNDLKLAKSVKYNDTISGDSGVFNVLSKMRPQVMKIRRNSKNEIKQIQTPTVTENYISDEFTKTEENTYMYRPTVKSFDNILYLEDSAKLFVFPENDSDSRDDYYVTDAASYFSETTFSISAYDIDSFGYSKVFSVKGSNESKRMSQDLYVVTDINKVLASNGDVHMKITGCGSGYKDIGFLVKEDSVVNNIQKGDVINFILDQNGFVSKVSSPISRLQDEFKTSISSQSTDYYQTKYISAEVDDIDFENGRIKLNYGSGTISFPFNSNVNCMEYNTVLRECDLINYDNVIKGDKVFVMTRYYGISEIIRITD